MAPNPYQQLAIQAAKAYGLDPSIFTRQIAAESNFNPNARSSAGAQGIAQFMPATAKGMGVNPYDPKSALYGAARMDAGNLKKYGGSYESMLSAYNSGNANAWKDPNFAKGETANYVKKIMGGMNPLVASSNGTAPPVNNDSRNSLLQYLLQSNTALINHQTAPSINPMLAAMAGQTANSNGVGTSIGAGKFQGGDPVVNGTSIGGEHDTEGLAGYPAKDYFAPAGSETVAPISGKIVKLSGHDPTQGPTEGPHGPLGWSVYIQGSDGHTYYLTHMGSRNVKIGQTVKAGQPIGTVANYDKYGTPSHIHMGVH